MSAAPAERPGRDRPRVTGIVLAAGAGTRMGAPKAEVVIAGERLLERAVRVLSAGGCDEIVAVVRDGVQVKGTDVKGTDVAGTDVAGTDVAGTDVAGTDVAGTDVAGIEGTHARVESVTAVVNPDPERGMGSSLRLGLSAATGDRGVIMLVDTPGITAEAVRRTLAVRAPVAIATYHGRRGHPVVIDRRLWAEVAELAEGDAGARGFLRAHPELVVEVACEGDPSDIDTPDDLARFLRTAHHD